MKKLVKESQLRKSNDVDKCKLILQIIKGQAEYKKGE